MSIAQRAVWRIDIDKGSPAVKTKNDLYQGDSQANSFACELYRGDTPVTITGYTVTGAFDRSDGATVPCKGTATSNTAEVLLNEHCYRNSGPFTLSIQLTKGEESRTILRIAGTVQSSGEGPVVDTDEVLVDLDELLALVDETKEAAQAAAEAAEAANAARESITDALNMTASGIVVDDIEPADMVHIEDAAARPVVELISYIEPVQAGSGDPSPDNVRAISGWDSASVTNDTSGQTLTADLPETVYGGSHVWNNGLLTVHGEKIVFDGVSNKATNISQQASTGLYYATLLLPKSSVRTLDNPLNPLSDKFVTKGKIEGGCCYIAGSSYRNLVVTPIDQTLTTVEAVNAWLADNPVTFIYDLAEPYTIQLTPQQFDVLQGTNNVWSNCGETKLVYVADTKKYIDEKIAALAVAQLGV